MRRLVRLALSAPAVTCSAAFAQTATNAGPELYVADGLHMTPAGYAIWTTALRPALR